ncbi:MAG: DTW domain-containing protein [Deltaproteobacteria bacterium]|nr:DTW domain-containing protein [Deltaproteobacteria bacterium]
MKSTPTEPEARHRVVCLSCFRPSALCFCQYLVRVENRTPLLIIQHPHERFHPFGTARIAERCLGNVRIAVDYDRGLRDGIRPLELPEGAALLYPGPGARDLAQVPDSELPRSLVVLDGTWHQARSLYRDIPALHELPKFTFNPSQPSQYRIRKEPRLECVSTIEAVVCALEHLEPETQGLEAMLRAFAGMIDLQLEAARMHQRKPRFSSKHRSRPHGLPRLFDRDYERVVVVYGEATFTGAAPPDRNRNQAKREPKKLIQWVARRLRTGERFSAVIKPDELPVENRLCPTGLSADDLRNGLEMQRARLAWHEFIEPEDLLLSWNKSTLDIMHPLQHQGDATFLKGIYKNFARRRDPQCQLDGSIDAVMEREGLRPCPSPHSSHCIGRAGLRLAQLESLVRYIHDCGISWPLAPPAKTAPHT